MHNFEGVGFESAVKAEAKNGIKEEVTRNVII